MTSGHREFISWVDSQPSKRDAAAQLGFQETELGHFYHGRRRPNRVKCLIIETVTGISHLGWMTDDEVLSYQRATGKALSGR